MTISTESIFTVTWKFIVRNVIILCVLLEGFSLNQKKNYFNLVN